MLKLTLVTNGGIPDTFIGRVAVVDEDSLQVSFAVSKDRSHRVVSFVGASFLVGKRRLEAERPEDEEFLMCEEIG